MEIQQLSLVPTYRTFRQVEDLPHIWEGDRIAMSVSAKPSLFTRIILSRWLAGLLLVASTVAVLGATGGYCHEAECLRIGRLPHNQIPDDLERYRDDVALSKQVFFAALGVLALACTSLVLGGGVRGSWRKVAEDDVTGQASSSGKWLSYLGLVLLFVGLVMAAGGAGGIIECVFQMQRFSREEVTEHHGDSTDREIIDVFYTGQDDLSFTYRGLLKDKHGEVRSLAEAEAIWNALGTKHWSIGGRQRALQMTAEDAREGEAWDFGAGFSRRQLRATHRTDDRPLGETTIMLERKQLADILEGAFRQDQYRAKREEFAIIGIAGGVILAAALAVLFVGRQKGRGAER